MKKKRKSRYRDEILRLRKDGKKYREIRKILGCCIFTIYNCLKDTDLVKIQEDDSEWVVEKIGYLSRAKVRNRKIVDDYLKNHPCTDCGNTDIRVLEFDHVKGEKVGNIAKGVVNAWPVSRLIKEIEKCEVRCSNCHRIITRERRLKN